MIRDVEFVEKGRGLAPLELAVEECRFVSQNRSPVEDHCWTRASDLYKRLDWETLSDALGEGLVVCIAAEAHEVGKIETCATFEHGQPIDVWYDPKQRLLWIREGKDE